MKYMVAIPDRAPPKLKDRNLPDELHSFIQRCLTKNVKKRPFAKDLFKEPFVYSALIELTANNGKNQVLRDLCSFVEQELEELNKESNNEIE